MIAEVAQAASEAAKINPWVAEGIYGLLVTNTILIIRDLIKARAERQKARAQVDEAEAEALKAQAQALSGKVPPAQNGNGIHEKYVLPHSLELQRLDGAVKVMDKRFEKFEQENSKQHDNLAEKLDDIRDLVIGKAAGAA